MPVSRARNLIEVTLNQFELGSCQRWKSPTIAVIGRDIGTLTMMNDDCPTRIIFSYAILDTRDVHP